ncbi:CWF19-like protein 2 [Chenopodium quinoa]|uniref:CWF19-like protein 2 n=1 Tax=Chenopodium quinoa TaxID=63459 RepID=UPI000B78C41E|nr:CWF19-like protein 2 [Chenopodium quinoa]
MLSGVKLISRDQVDRGKFEESCEFKKDGRKSSSKKEKSRRKKKGSEYSSSDDGGHEKIRKRSRKKKWYSSDEYSDPESGEDDSRGRRKRRSKGKEKDRKYDDSDVSDDAGGPSSTSNIDIVRKEMGLDWMCRPAERAGNSAQPAHEEKPLESGSEEMPKKNPRELNPYLRDNGSGYPGDEDQTKSSSDQLLSSSVVGDGGASWRMKALKRAQEQATREGRNVKEVVQERWGSLGHLAVSVASHIAAAPRAHLHAIKSRRMGAGGEAKSDSNNESKRGIEKDIGHEYVRNMSVRHPEMKAPKNHDSLSWGRKKGQKMRSEDAAVVSNALSSLNSFSNDGNFMSEFMNQHKKAKGDSQDASSPKSDTIREANSDSVIERSGEDKQPLSANQLAAKAMQLRLKGKHEEAEKLLREAENNKVDHNAGERLVKLRNDVSSSRYSVQEKQLQQKGREDDGDRHLAQTIMKNQKYSLSTQADDEYDFDGAPAKKSKRKGADNENRSHSKQNVAKRIVTQQERCQFCFENPKRPKHLVVAIANFTYLMLPQFQPVAPGHCCISTLQHELATRMVDDNVWEEIRNFKKCLIMMAAKQDKEMIFLETVLWLAQQRRHCLIECIPLPKDIAKEAPLYFKKAIDEAEDEWSQHNAKKLIDTSQKGLRGSIPKNFPYFHVEFGLSRGFVHVIDDETEFKSSFGLNVIRGMLQSQDENMYRRRQYESIEVQKEALAAFARDWDPFNWTKQLE